MISALSSMAAKAEPDRLAGVETQVEDVAPAQPIDHDIGDHHLQWHDGADKQQHQGTVAEIDRQVGHVLPASRYDLFQCQTDRRHAEQDLNIPAPIELRRELP
jgi:hypothetical protein